MSKKNDDYIDKYQDDDEINPILTDRSMFAPLVFGGFSVVSMILYFIGLSIGDITVQLFIFIVPLFASAGLIGSLIKLKERFSYILWWRIGFYSCAASLAAFVIVILAAFVRAIIISGLG